MKNLMFEIEDIKRVGNTTSKHESGTSFIISGDSYLFEYILLRNILEVLGYEIISEEDFHWEHKDEFDCDIECITTLPFSEYLEIK